MTEIQNNIVGKVLMDAGVMTIPITEEWITMMVDSYEKQATLMGAAALTEAEKEDVITTLHSRLFVQIDRGHCLKEKDHTPWYMAAKADQPSNFWDGCRYFVWPKSNPDFWKAKIEGTVERDRRKTEELKKAGWNVVVIWECQLKPGAKEETLQSLARQLKMCLSEEV